LIGCRGEKHKGDYRTVARQSWSTMSGYIIRHKVEILNFNETQSYHTHANHIFEYTTSHFTLVTENTPFTYVCVVHDKIFNFIAVVMFTKYILIYLHVSMFTTSYGM
jgi:hypothetical protein